MHEISKILCEAYRELYKEGQVSFPLNEQQKQNIDSIVKTVNARYFGFQRYATAPERAVAYLCLIIKNHPVVDGNKRLAILWFKVYCMISKLKPDSSVYSLDELAVAIEAARPEDVDFNDLTKLVKFILFENKKP